MSHFGIITSFDHTCNSWSIYKSRLNQWFIANDITSSTDMEGVKRRGILLSALVDNTYKLAVNLALPKDIQNVPFDDIIKLLDTHFTPKRLGFIERYKFYSAQQNVHESEAEFIARLQGLSKHCQFKDPEEALRDRFVLGLHPGPARDELLEQKLEELTLAKALEIVRRARCVQEVNEAQKWRTQPVFGGTKIQPYQPPFYSGQSNLFGTQAQSGQATFGFGTQQSSSTTFGAAQNLTPATFWGAQIQTSVPGVFQTQTQSSRAATFGGTQAVPAASSGAPKPLVSGTVSGISKPPLGGSFFGIPKPQQEQASHSAETKIELVKQDNP